MSRRRMFVLLAVPVSGLIGATAWAAVVPSKTPVDRTAESRVVHLYQAGFGSSCDGDACGASSPRPMSFRLPAAETTYSGTITVSLSYSTTGDGRFLLDPAISGAGGRHPRGAVLPAGRLLAPTRYPTAATVVFRVRDVPADTALDFWVSFGIGERETAKTSITARNALVELRVSPTG